MFSITQPVVDIIFCAKNGISPYIKFICSGIVLCQIETRKWTGVSFIYIVNRGKTMISKGSHFRVLLKIDIFLLFLFSYRIYNFSDCCVDLKDIYKTIYVTQSRTLLIISSIIHCATIDQCSHCHVRNFIGNVLRYDSILSDSISGWIFHMRWYILIHAQAHINIYILIIIIEIIKCTIKK